MIKTGCSNQLKGLTLLISLACHFLVAVDNSSALNPDSTRELIFPNIGVR